MSYGWHGRLVFQANDGASSAEPWISDGSAGGTQAIADVAPGVGSSDPGPFVVVGDRTFFVAITDDFGLEVWTSVVPPLPELPARRGRVVPEMRRALF